MANAYVLLDAAFKLIDYKMRRDEILAQVAEHEDNGASFEQIAASLKDMAYEAIRRSQETIDSAK